MSSIYELTGEYLELMNMLEDEEVDEQTIIDTLEALDGEIENKADNYAKIIRSLESDIDGISKENNRLNLLIMVMIVWLHHLLSEKIIKIYKIK